MKPDHLRTTLVTGGRGGGVNLSKREGYYVIESECADDIESRGRKGYIIFIGTPIGGTCDRTDAVSVKEEKTYVNSPGRGARKKG